MARPLIITDCDEVLLHMVVPFQGWLDEVHGIHFALDHGNFAEALRHTHDGTLVASDRVWPLLDGFFATEMHRQGPIAGAVEALGRLAAVADVAVLTNLLDHRRDARAEQLAGVGITAPVSTNQGGKGAAARALVDRYAPSAVVFIDDLANHHESVGRHVPEAWRLHMVGEPVLAPHIAPAPAAHARIDTWAEAESWIFDRLEGHAA